MGALLIDRLEGGSPALIRGATGAAAVGGDPFDGGMWPTHRDAYLGANAIWRNDPAMLVLAPPGAEDSAHVPFTLDATGLDAPVERIEVTVDYSPFARALTFHPGRALPFLSFGVKYEIGGALRASARVPAGDWRVGAAYVSALGGGCSAPAATHARPDWQQGFGEIRGRIWPETGRLRLRIRHPQDTGLADGIPAHFLTDLTLTEADGTEIARLTLHEPVEENPAFTFLLPPALMAGAVLVGARDNMGNRFAGRMEARR
ncbi:quinoprotein dehydrogenase-associated SoxYZ-like carrier [Paenirhodobacter sp.]|uniref:quinoprotein dehydrogenase-associated SoxYZ-like carrier n=1 Tax=Paenirhodobacter sp. TaxID=1965326 RepID=UPI003B3FB035